MTDLVVQRLRITCRSGKAGRHDALATRGRLEVIARTRLPQLLALRTTAWDDDVRLNDLTVRLDFDPRHHDDETVAVRWAALIASAVEEEAGAAELRRRVRHPPVDGAARERDAATTPGAAIAQGALPAGASSDPLRGAPLSRDQVHLLVARALAGDATAGADLVAAILDPAAWSTVLPSLEGRGLAAVLRWLESTPEGLAGDATEALGTRMRRSRSAPPAAGAADLDGAPRPDASRVAKAVAEVRAASDAQLEPQRGLPGAPEDRITDDRFITACGGLAIAYPWLVSLLQDAVDARPELDPIGVRRQALAAVAGHQYLADDALVRLLAGDELTSPASALAPPDEHAALDRSAEELLAQFAAAIAGFETSPPDYVRREFILRPGTIDLAASPVTIELPPAPLDPALTLLPYPLGLFALPWTRTLVIRLEQG